jgi:pyridoxamine 5'-phosphate oxidase-like protein
MHWHEFETQQPTLAGIGARKLTGPGVILVGTIRRDGSPRISPVEPLLWDGDLWLCMGLGSHKAADLRRDPRILVHSIVTNRTGQGGEYKLRGTAAEDTDTATQARCAEQVASRLGWRPEPGKFHLFRVDLGDITFIRWDDATNDQYVTRWPAGTEVVRRGTSATSQGPPEPHPGLLRHP